MHIQIEIIVTMTVHFYQQIWDFRLKILNKSLSICWHWEVEVSLIRAPFQRII